jgi:hypothetical protein
LRPNHAVTLAEKQTQLLEDLSVIDDPQERLSLVVNRRCPTPSAPMRTASAAAFPPRGS